MFTAVNPKVDIQKVEQEQLEFWRTNRIFQRTTEGRESAPKYIFYEGPPTANGKPGSHHVLARAFKDMFPRYKVMRGYYCLRRGGWDTHGLPVEIAVEKELGLTSKREIEEYGIAKFNEKCRASVFRYIADWEKLTERIAFWVDLDDAYITFTNDYIESVWWILKQLWDKSLIYRGYKVVPYCTRCGTPLSSHELSLGYDTIKDPSVFVRFPLRDQPGVYFLAWTTTPWTLPGNTALAVGEDVDYVQVEGPAPDGEGTEHLILATQLMNKVLKNPQDYKIIKRWKGKELVGQHYNPLYTFLPIEGDYAYVVAGDFVSIEDGTGIVHIAPAFGQDDAIVAEKYGLPTLRTVSANGKFIDAVDKFRGMWFKEADPHITRDLRERGLLYKQEQYEHNYPFCWRCDTPLMYFARETWFIRSTEYKDKMVQLNQTINWVPEHVRDGRFGNWLDDLKDWALGRERFWGTPLPIWVDEQSGDMICVGSIEELSRLAGRDLSDLDLHRPYVDEITFPNPNGSGGVMRRVPEVIDVWFDSGAMPVAQWGYPHHHQDKFEEQFPADYICEAVDQTRGWFYSLHAISTMLFESVSYKNVICLGHILDENGHKMSKSRGNIVDPWDVINANGADAFRWYLYTSSPPGESRRFSNNLVAEVVRKFWLTLWNTYSFFVTYANVDGWTPATEAQPVAERDLLDRWVLAELHQLIKKVTQAYEEYDVPNATRPIQSFVESLSNWYVRLSRRRFWKSENDADKSNAYATLYECLTTIAYLIAPSMPFLSEALYRNLVAEQKEDAPDSVHLASWPTYKPELIDDKLIDEMDLVQRLVSVGLAARNTVQIGVRQPLKSVAFGIRRAEDVAIIEKYTDLIKSELNVKSVQMLDAEANVVHYGLNPLPQVLGKKYGKAFPAIQKALRSADSSEARQWAQRLLNGDAIEVFVEGQMYHISSDECEVRQSSAVEGFAVATDRGYVAALDTTLTPELINEGLAREVVRRIQNMRRDAGLNVEDHIYIVYQATERFAKAIEQFEAYIRIETLADDLQAKEPDDGYYSELFTFDKGELDGESVLIGLKRS